MENNIKTDSKEISYEAVDWNLAQNNIHRRTILNIIMNLRDS
jgi:hypothetical protein